MASDSNKGFAVDLLTAMRFSGPSCIVPEGYNVDGRPTGKMFHAMQAPRQDE
jgi:hypothetical protein